MATTHAPAAEILRLLPQPKPDDVPEVAHALTEAYSLWSRGRRSDAVTLLRGAIVRAAENGGSDRANELAKQVTDLVNALHAPVSPSMQMKAVEAKSSAAPKAPPPPPRGRVPAGGKPPAPAPKAKTNGVEVKSEPKLGAALAPAPTPAPALDPPIDPFPTAPAITTAAEVAPDPFPSVPPPPKPIEGELAQPTEAAPITAKGEDTPSAAAAPTNASPPPPRKSVFPVALKRRMSTTPPDLDEAWGAEGSDHPASQEKKVEPPTARPAGPDDGAKGTETPGTIPPETKPRESFGAFDLERVEVLSDVPDDALAAIVAGAEKVLLAQDERAPAPPMIVVVGGDIEIGVPGRDCAVSVLSAGSARILAPQKPCGDPLVVTAYGGTARYLAVDDAAIAKLRAAAPWVADELASGCDAIHALSGVLAGRFGGTLSEPLFAELRKNCEARRLPAGALVMKQGEPVRGLLLLAAGELEKSPNDGEEFSCGEVVFLDELLSGKNAPATVRAGREGALLLVARRAQTKALLAQPELAKLLRA